MGVLESPGKVLDFWSVKEWEPRFYVWAAFQKFGIYLGFFILPLDDPKQFP